MLLHNKEVKMNMSNTPTTEEMKENERQERERNNIIKLQTKEKSSQEKEEGKKITKLRQAETKRLKHNTERTLNV